MSIPLHRAAHRDHYWPQALTSNHAAHPQLLLQRGLAWLTSPKEDSSAAQNQTSTGATPAGFGDKAQLIADLCRQAPSAGYRQAYQRWAKLTADPECFYSAEHTLCDRLFIGLGNANSLEANVATQHSWGMPYLPGSAIKGCVRAYAEQLGVPAEYAAVLFGSPHGQALAAGCLAWHDAWWIPPAAPATANTTQSTPASSPFVAEIVTPHHSAYYSGQQASASAFDDPIPCPQIAVRGSFRFLIAGPKDWTRLAGELLTASLTQSGLGGRQAAGYGRFIPPPPPPPPPLTEHWPSASLTYTPNNCCLTASYQGKRAQLQFKDPAMVNTWLATYCAGGQATSDQLLSRLRKGKTTTLAVTVTRQGNGYQLDSSPPPAEIG